METALQKCALIQNSSLQLRQTLKYKVPRAGVCLLQAWSKTPCLRVDLGGVSHFLPYIEVNILKYLENLDNQRQHTIPLEPSKS